MIKLGNILKEVFNPNDGNYDSNRYSLFKITKLDTGQTYYRRNDAGRARLSSLDVLKDVRKDNQNNNVIVQALNSQQTIPVNEYDVELVGQYDTSAESKAAYNNAISTDQNSTNSGAGGGRGTGVDVNTVAQLVQRMPEFIVKDDGIYVNDNDFKLILQRTDNASLGARGKNSGDLYKINNYIVPKPSFVKGGKVYYKVVLSGELIKLLDKYKNRRK